MKFIEALFVFENVLFHLFIFLCPHLYGTSKITYINMYICM